MKKIEYVDRLYEFKIILIESSWNEFIKFLEKEDMLMFLGEPANSMFGPEGFHFVVPELSEAYMFINKKKGEKTLNLRTFVHELNHVCLAIFDSRGIKVSSEYSEAYCYYFDFLFNYFTKK